MRILLKSLAPNRLKTISVKRNLLSFLLQFKACLTVTAEIQRFACSKTLFS